MKTSTNQRKMAWILSNPKMGIVVINYITVSIECMSSSASFVYGK